MQDQPNEQDRREPGRLTPRTGDEIVVSLPDPERPGHPRRFRALVIERLGRRRESGETGEREGER